ncbi:unnamed protein product [Calypogeia fissa]
MCKSGSVGAVMQDLDCFSSCAQKRSTVLRELLPGASGLGLSTCGDRWDGHGTDEDSPMKTTPRLMKREDRQVTSLDL